MARKEEKVNRIEVGFRKSVRDALGEKVRRRIVEHLRINVDEVRTIDVYTVEGSLSRGEIKQIAEGPLTDPVIRVMRSTVAWPSILTGSSRWASGRVGRTMWEGRPPRPSGRFWETVRGKLPGSTHPGSSSFGAGSAVRRRSASPRDFSPMSSSSGSRSSRGKTGMPEGDAPLRAEGCRWGATACGGDRSQRQ